LQQIRIIDDQRRLDFIYISFHRFVPFRILHRPRHKATPHFTQRLARWHQPRCAA